MDQRDETLDAESEHSAVFNGCIYNFSELRWKLAGKGYRFQSTGDIVVVLKDGAEWGRIVSRVSRPDRDDRRHRRLHMRTPAGSRHFLGTYPRGAARTDLARAKSSPDRAIVFHLDDKMGVAAVLTAGEWSAELALHPLY